jgi:hypothetical protein
MQSGRQFKPKERVASAHAEDDVALYCIANPAGLTPYSVAIGEEGPRLSFAVLDAQEGPISVGSAERVAYPNLCRRRERSCRSATL